MNTKNLYSFRRYKIFVFILDYIDNLNYNISVQIFCTNKGDIYYENKFNTIEICIK